MSLSLNTLQYIVGVAEASSISKASELFYLSQPHLSNSIRSVEKELGVTLFHRSSKGMKLTEEGRFFVTRAKRILAQMEDLEDAFQKGSSERVNLHISITRSYQILRVISDFINENVDKPMFQMYVKETDPFTVLEDVRSGKADMGALHFYETQQEYFHHYFNLYNIFHTNNYVRPFLIAMSVENPLAQISSLTFELLREQIIVLYGDYETMNAPYRFVNNEGVISSRKLRVYDRSSMMDILSRCPQTYTLITGLHPVTLAQYNLVLRKCTDLSLNNIGCFIYRKNDRQSPVVKQLFAKLNGQINWTERVSD